MLWANRPARGVTLMTTAFEDHAWKFRYSAACLWPTVRTALAEVVSYQTIMDLDHKIRTFPIPLELQPPLQGYQGRTWSSDPASAMQQFCFICERELSECFHTLSVGPVSDTVPRLVVPAQELPRGSDTRRARQSFGAPLWRLGHGSVPWRGPHVRYAARLVQGAPGVDGAHLVFLVRRVFVLGTYKVAGLAVKHWH